MTNARSALLIDDEPLARMELRRLLAAHPHVVIIGEAATMNDARSLLSRPGYDLVFLDVQLRGGTGFDLLDSVAPDADVIFVSAYDQYAIRAFEVNALDYLLKPVAATRLASSLERLGARPTQATSPAGWEGPVLKTDDRVIVKSGNTTRFVTVATIGAVRSCENYTEVFLATGEKLLVLRSLKSWEDRLPRESFVRVHRQALVNLSHVKRVVRSGDDDVQFQLTEPLPAISASRRQLAELKQRFAAAGMDGVLP
jgi:two-component system LytT family response regulator